MTDTSPWRQLLQHTDSQYHMMKNAKTVEVSIMTDTKPRLNARTYHVVKKRTSTSKKCVGSRNTGVTKMERRIGPPKYVLPVRKTTRTTTSLAKKPSPVLKTPSTLQNSNKTSNKKLENNVASKNIQSMHPFRPSQSDLDEQVNDRAKQSLIVWHQRLNEYVHFCDVNGHGCVPQKYEKNNKLGTWVNKQRMERKIREDRGDKFGLSDWKISKLNEAGFVWATPKGPPAWENQYTALLKFNKEHGHCDVPTKYKKNTSLGRWISEQRSNYKKYKNFHVINVNADEMDRRIDLLNKIGFIWSKDTKK